MPLVFPDYKPSFPFKNGHVSTIFSASLRKVNGITQHRERLILPDTDFLDLDWSYALNHKSESVVLIIHGLEGNAQRPYVLGAAKLYNQYNIDVCAVNLRGCSGSSNALFSSYHSGITKDLKAVIDYVLAKFSYKNIFINGFSLGGNLALKYVANVSELPKEVKGVIGISVPCNLHNSVQQLLLPKNRLYEYHFRKKLLKKLLAKQRLYPEKISVLEITSIRSLLDFDEVYTSKAHGFVDALDYYTQASCVLDIPKIQIPCLIINAKNDSFLGESCYPEEIAKVQNNLFLEIPHFGGHVGYYFAKKEVYNESRSLKFMQELI